MHTLDLPDGNRTSDTDINALALRDGWIVVSKDADFVNSHLLRGLPPRLLVVSTGNVTNDELQALFAARFAAINAAFQTSRYVELTRTHLIIHA